MLDFPDVEAAVIELLTPLASCGTVTPPDMEGRGLICTTALSDVLTVTSGVFAASDVGASVAGAGIPAGTTILSFTSTTSVVMSNAATAAATGVTVQLSRLPFIRITRVGGGDDRITDNARVSVDAFAGTRADSYTLAEAIRQKMLLWPIVLSNCVIDRIITTTGPMEVSWGDVNVRRRVATYTVSTRRPTL